MCWGCGCSRWSHRFRCPLFGARCWVNFAVKAFSRCRESATRTWGRVSAQPKRSGKRGIAFHRAEFLCKRREIRWTFRAYQGSLSYQIRHAHVFWRSDARSQIQFNETIGKICAICQSTQRNQRPWRQELLGCAMIAGHACNDHPAREDTPAEPVQAVVQGALKMRVLIRWHVVESHGEHRVEPDDRGEDPHKQSRTLRYRYSEFQEFV